MALPRSVFKSWRYFPSLNKGNFSVKSPVDVGYNCIAWAAGENDRRWDIVPGYHWPDGVPREQSVEALIAALQTVGYVECEDNRPEKNHEKVALYSKETMWTHVARLLPNRRWTSKIGSDTDIEHRTLESLNGEQYGKVVKYMKRRMASQGKPSRKV